MAVKLVTENCVEACFKGYDTYEEACAIWHSFNCTGMLPLDTIDTLGKRGHPTPPLVDNPSIAGLHLPPACAPPSPTLRPSPGPQPAGVVFNISATGSHVPWQQTPSTPQRHTTPQRHSQSPTVAPQRRGPTETVSASRATLLAQRRGTPMATTSHAATSHATTSHTATSHAATQIAEVWVITVGEKPGVYPNPVEGRAALGMFPHVIYELTNTMAAGWEIFGLAYMARAVVRVSRE